MGTNMNETKSEVLKVRITPTIRQACRNLRASGAWSGKAKEIAEAAGVTSETVRVKGKELFPERFVNGRKTEFNQKEAISIMSELRKKGFIQPTENLEVPTGNLEVVTKGDLAAFGAAIVSDGKKRPPQRCGGARNRRKHYQEQGG